MTPSYLKTRVQMAVHALTSRTYYGLTHYRHPDRAEALARITKARSIVYTATTPLEAVEIFTAVKAVEKIAGDIAEVGVFNGGTALILLDASERHLHLFDTFEGLPTSGDHLKRGEYAGSIQQVTRTLIAFANRITLYKGMFPQDTAAAIEGLKFSFVHLDMDLYDGTLEALRFFWPRINPGGILLCHDYPSISGVKQAMDEFFKDQQTPLLPMSGHQAMVVKI